MKIEKAFQIAVTYEDDSTATFVYKRVTNITSLARNLQKVKPYKHLNAIDLDTGVAVVIAERGVLVNV